MPKTISTFRRKCILGVACAALASSLAVCACGCAQQSASTADNQNSTMGSAVLNVNDVPANTATTNAANTGTSTNDNTANAQGNTANTESAPSAVDAEALRAKLDLSEDYRESFTHGPKTAAYQKYIVLHDTESNADAESVIEYWDSNGAGVAAHFVINTDGSIVQCVPLDVITHHAGYGDTGHNADFGITEDGRDDMVGSTPIGSWASDYGMNAWSVGIEMVHVGGSGDYPEAQLNALDDLIAYINAYYGFQSTITDHKAWRTGNSDTSEEFATYLANYQDHNTHN